MEEQFWEEEMTAVAVVLTAEEMIDGRGVVERLGMESRVERQRLGKRVAWQWRAAVAATVVVVAVAAVVVVERRRRRRKVGGIRCLALGIWVDI